jgi:hypothetical protein
MIFGRRGTILFLMRNAILLLLLTASAAAQSIGTFTPTGTMTVARTQHTATLLNDGRVLIAGGMAGASLDSALASAELYDPSTGKFSATGKMADARRGHTATLLADGRVLIAGGWDLTSAEIYDAATGLFTPTGSLLEDQGFHTATLLPNGKVLIAGGERVARPWPTAAHAELYDPATGTFSLASDYAEAGTLYTSGGPVWPTANLLRDGRVLVVGENPPEIYDPAAETFRVGGALIERVYRFGMEAHGATTLRDGTVLVTGGNDDWTCGAFDAAEIYDPSSGTFSVVGPMNASRDFQTATLLQDGSVLIAGGGSGGCRSSTLDTAEIYLPSTRSFVLAPQMSHPRMSHTATLLNDGTVLIAGGASYWPYGVTATAELYRPAAPRSGRIGSHR